MLVDYYEILGLSRTASIDEIKRAYRQRALASHPDRGGSHEAMLKVNEAFEILRNPETRSNYDRAWSNQADNAAQNQFSSDAARARDTAENYPRNWNEFESWLARVTKDFTSAEYGKWQGGGLYVPTAKNSTSGKLFIIAGGAVGFFIAAAMFAEDARGSSALMRVVGLGGIAAGAFIGKVIHQAIGDSLKGSSNPVAEHGPTDAQQSTSADNSKGASEKRVIYCVNCGQQLRIPTNAGSSRIRCGACKHEFAVNR
jgi:hypothetical protein